MFIRHPVSPRYTLWVLRMKTENTTAPAVPYSKNLSSLPANKKRKKERKKEKEEKEKEMHL